MSTRKPPDQEEPPPRGPGVREGTGAEKDARGAADFGLPPDTAPMEADASATGLSFCAGAPTRRRANARWIRSTTGRTMTDRPDIRDDGDPGWITCSPVEFLDETGRDAARTLLPLPLRSAAVGGAERLTGIAPGRTVGSGVTRGSVIRRVAANPRFEAAPPTGESLKPWSPENDQPRQPARLSR
jgi:hypothetical protein